MHNLTYNAQECIFNDQSLEPVLILRNEIDCYCSSKGLAVGDNLGMF